MSSTATPWMANENAGHLEVTLIDDTVLKIPLHGIEPEVLLRGAATMGFLIDRSTGTYYPVHRIKSAIAKQEGQ